ncbi:hypothetical protein VOWphi5012_076 [Vibrio phage phi50-12]|uniref:Uncharacterized protein n=1 Tax=Vibrio phage phi50-12 TaxID=2654972 RepID=A0A5P8PRD5_9CAUD|nr:hypothetical protein KNU82_gp076 [Vibrio phage phi50-12]QFR59860.1 hypothetical protein VOWphi5012_076 [Vibrio phage phi50-12]
MNENLEVIVCKLKPDWVLYDTSHACDYNVIPNNELDKTYTLKGHTDVWDDIFLKDKHTSPFIHKEDGRPIACFSLNHFDIILRKHYVKEIPNSTGTK